MQSRSQIVATIGPASGELRIIEQMISSGMDVARINFSHGTHASNGSYIANIRAAAKAAGKNIPIIQDLSGPRMKTDSGHAFDANDPVVTEKDLSDLDFGIKTGVDYIAQSYVGSAKDISVLRGAMKKRGVQIPIIAKIERAEAIKNFDGILSGADAVMIARGDLGLNVPIEDIPFLERDIVAKCRAAGKPVIVATQMLYSMVEKESPTRAEVTDTAFAIVTGADAVMLSDETARGKYPVESVATMEKIVARSERGITGGINPL